VEPAGRRPPAASCRPPPAAACRPPAAGRPATGLDPMGPHGPHEGLCFDVGLPTTIHWFVFIIGNNRTYVCHLICIITFVTRSCSFFTLAQGCSEYIYTYIIYMHTYNCKLLYPQQCPSRFCLKIYTFACCAQLCGTTVRHNVWQMRLHGAQTSLLMCYTWFSHLVWTWLWVCTRALPLALKSIAKHTN